MLLVILGAGASHDSAPDTAVDPGRRSQIPEWRPPLAKDLFEARTHFGATIELYSDYCAGLVVALRNAVATGRNLERLLDEVSVRAQADAFAATELMAVRYYLQNVLWFCSEHWLSLTHKATNYHWLVSRLDRWARENDECVLYVTFNYDTLLEHAVRQAQLYVTDLASYVAHPRLRIFKLHGSVNWAHQVAFPIPVDLNERDYVIQNASELEIPPEISIKTDWGMGIRGQEHVPALAVPIESKGDFECPPEHVEMLERLLPEVDRLLVIGWKAAEKNFLEMLGKSTRALEAALVACNGEYDSYHTSKRIMDARQSAMSTRSFESWQNTLGFSNLVASDELEQFLGSSAN